MSQDPVDAMPSPDGKGGPTLASAVPARVDWFKWLVLGGGFALFLVVYFAEAPAAAVDPAGRVFPLTHAGKAALGLFLLAAVWWVTNVLPLGITAIAIGVFQALFQIRAPKEAFGDFMDPAVWFIFASVVIGMAFTRSGLTLRLAYKMLTLVGERTECDLSRLFPRHHAAHPADGAHRGGGDDFPGVTRDLYALCATDRPSRFGKGLFIGMAFSAGAGSIITLLGSARGIVGLTFFRDITGQRVGFFDIPYYLAPVGFTMVLITWGLMLLLFPPEKKLLPGLGEVAARYYRELGPVRRDEWLSLLIVLGAIGLLAAQAVIPAGPAEPAGDPSRHHAAVLRVRCPDPEGAGGNSLEHNPAVRRCHEHRLLPAEHGGG